MPPDYRKIARNKALRYGINPDYFVRQIGAESNFNPNARSPVGATGIAQIMPGTARGWGVDPTNPIASLDAAAKNMARYVNQYGSYRDALVAYNAGPGRVGKPLYAETRGYIDKILGPGNKGSSQTTPAGSLRLPALPGTGSTTDGGNEPTGLPTPRFNPQQRAALGMVFKDNPRMQRIFDLAQLAGSVSTQPDVPKPARRAAVRAVKNGPGTDYASLFRWANKNFGALLDNPNPSDPNNRQTIGGSHTAGSNHYKGRAIDLGDAKNNPATLRRIAAYARRNPHLFRELIFNPLGWGIKNGKVIKGFAVKGHDNHMHIAV